MTPQPPSSFADVRRIAACPGCGSADLAPTHSLVGHVLAKGLAAPFYPRGKVCGACGWRIEVA